MVQWGSMAGFSTRSVDFGASVSDQSVGCLVIFVSSEYFFSIPRKKCNNCNNWTACSELFKEIQYISMVLFAQMNNYYIPDEFWVGPQHIQIDLYPPETLFQRTKLFSLCKSLCRKYKNFLTCDTFPPVAQVIYEEENKKKYSEI